MPETCEGARHLKGAEYMGDDFVRQLATSRNDLLKALFGLVEPVREVGDELTASVLIAAILYATEEYPAVVAGERGPAEASYATASFGGRSVSIPFTMLSLRGRAIVKNWPPGTAEFSTPAVSEFRRRAHVLRLLGITPFIEAGLRLYLDLPALAEAEARLELELNRSSAGQ